MELMLESWKDKFQHKHQVVLLCCSYQLHFLCLKQILPFADLSSHMHVQPPLHVYKIINTRLY